MAQTVLALLLTVRRAGNTSVFRMARRRSFRAQVASLNSHFKDLRLAMKFDTSAFPTPRESKGIFKLNH